MQMISIKSSIRNYNTVIGDVKPYLSDLRGRSGSVCLIVDHNVWSIYKNVFRSFDRKEIIILPVSEERKNLASVQMLYDKLMRLSAKRNMLLVSAGGGITQDITGFLASTLYRGLKWVFIPTTLLAQADSCIGSKTSLNYKEYKNIIGTFYPPVEILVDTRFIDTQKPLDFYSGMGEVVKLHIIGGRKCFDYMLKSLLKIVRDKGKILSEAVRNCLLIKKGYIENDEFDSGRRNLLNYGHCFGHAIEKTSAFGIPHGLAVTIGMALADIVARNRTILRGENERLIFNELLLPLIVRMPDGSALEPSSLMLAMKKDKKRTGKDLPLVMLKDGLELVKVDDLKESELKAAVKDFRRRICNAAGCRSREIRKT